MRLNVHDFSGHPFQVQLSRTLAAAGHRVLHGYSSQYVTGHGRLDVGPDDAPTLRIEGITAGAPYVKYDPVGRTRFELRYASAWQAALDRERHDVVVVSNVPLFALARMRRYFSRHDQPWVFWHQDLYSLGMGAEAARRLPPGASRLARGWVERLERAQVQGADAVVAITDAMVRQYREWGITRDEVHVIPNWAPLDEVRPGERDNRWARRQRLPERPLRLMYAGTLGRKHNPMLLVEILDAAKARGVDAYLIVVSEGIGADELKAATAGRADVLVLGYQPAEDMTEMLASADVVLAVLEPDAARFSVPSKVLTYLAAGRPIIGLLPSDNPAAADIVAVGGFVGEASSAGACNAAKWLARAASDPQGLAEVGARGRALATERFDIERIAPRFEDILERAVRSRRGPRLAVVASARETPTL